ncbi:sensor histidine kinase [Ruminococcus flavefaciens]|uniref:histidine kinase n=1 Tax=Ruminococcus flavefaciens TaxID=1265 RepID=A0A1K1NSX5_RUMFL|nr:HAMP domain-containing sensor histidine kinase [Ruminococcus flavefaciens]SFW38412.1 Signal transduction histidine kinase [Ruminococcus flavefaciens]
MDRTDRFINNRAPKKLLVIFLLLLTLSACAAFFISGKCADVIVHEQIRSGLSVAGGGKFTDFPDDDSISAGEEAMKKYSIDRSIPPRMMKNYGSVRRVIFYPVFGLLALISAIWYFISLRELMAIYRDLEKLRNECVKAADDSENAVITLYGEDLGSVHRISDAVEMLVDRLNNTKFSLSSEQRYLRVFLTDLSHQIKTSLAVVRLNTDMLTELDDLSEERREKLSDEIQLNLDGMERLVIEAIKFAKLEANAVEYDMQESDLSEVCQLAIKRISPLLRKKNITVRTQLPENITMLCDKSWLCEAVENILKNSADHSGCTEVSAEVTADPVMVKMILTDNGRGIPQENIPKLFERFSSKSSDTTMYSSGLGMSISQKIVRGHGGDILVYSEPDKGTRFEFVFLK